MTESEAIGIALANHGAAQADRFIQEVCWRSYWKAWLELRPGAWLEYRQDLARHLAAPPPGYAAAIAGATGIACFDAWVAELRATGTLHNHARMWFASIWIFTLRLPWELGADAFLRHLLDGDAAANTLSWRWVAGLQTPGKHYVARAANIAHYTGGRFDPVGALDEAPAPLAGGPPPPPRRLPSADAPPAGRVALLLHEDDLHPESLDWGVAQVMAIAGFAVPEQRSPLGCAPMVAAFTRGALADGLARAASHFAAPAVALAPEQVADWAAATGCSAVVAPWAPVGWTATALAEIAAGLAARGLRLHRVRRPWDDACWPLATGGFFPFRRHIPDLLARLVA